MLVVSDSSPLNFLVRMEQQELLPRLFERVLIPTEVEAELSRREAPPEVRRFLEHRPAWLEVRAPAKMLAIPRLDPGEEAAICLALEVGAAAILMDERAGRAAAQARGLVTIGLLGILDRADALGQIDLESVLRTLPEDYRIAPELLDEVRRRSKERRRIER